MAIENIKWSFSFQTSTALDWVQFFLMDPAIFVPIKNMFAKNGDLSRIRIWKASTLTTWPPLSSIFDQPIEGMTWSLDKCIRLHYFTGAPWRGSIQFFISPFSYELLLVKTKFKPVQTGSDLDPPSQLTMITLWSPWIMNSSFILTNQSFFPCSRYPWVRINVCLETIKASQNCQIL